MRTAADATVREIEVRVGLLSGSATLLLAVVDDRQPLDETRELLARIFRAGALTVRDLGATAPNRGPSAWAAATREGPADVTLVSFSSSSLLAASAFANLLNSQREALRELAGPVLLLLPRRIEAKLREAAPDFVTWTHACALPAIEELERVAASRHAVPVTPTAEDAAPPIRFLHLSDLHLRPSPTKRYDQDRVLGGLLKMLSTERATSPIDLIFVTGDLAQSGKDGEYEVVVAFLQDLLNATGVAHEHLFVVPGNHDVDRDVGRWLLRTLESDEEATEFFVVPGSRRWHEQKFSGWSERLRGWLGDHRALGLAVGADAVEYVEVRGTRIAVASFNSAWFAQGDDDRGRLWLGEASVSEASRYASRTALSVALMHHPTDDLAEIERTNVENHLERSFDLVLRGHLHKERARVIQGPRGTNLSIAAAAAYQGSQWPNGCFVGEIHPGRRTVRLQPFMFGSGADPWVLDARVFPDDAGDGYRHTFRLGDRKPPTASEEAASASAADAYWALERTDRLAIARQLGVHGRSSREIDEKVAELLQGTPEGVAVWEMLRARAGTSADVILLFVSKEAATDVLQWNGGVKISRSDSLFLEKALDLVAKAWQMGANGTVRGAVRGSASRASRLVGEILRAIVEGPLTGAASTGSQEHDQAADLVLGRAEDPPEQQAIIRCRRVETPGSSPTSSEELGRLDRELKASEGVQRALIILYSGTARKLERAVTPSGHEAHVLWLPLTGTAVGFKD